MKWAKAYLLHSAEVGDIALPLRRYLYEICLGIFKSIKDLSSGYFQDFYLKMRDIPSFATLKQKAHSSIKEAK